MKTLCLTLGLLFIFYPIVSINVSANNLQIRHISPESKHDQRSDYYIALLQLALDKTSETDGFVILSQSKIKMVQQRAIEQLKQNKSIDVMWTMTSIERETELQAIRIPLLKGLLGYRIFLIREDEADKFASYQTLEEIKQLTAGQGKSWPDTKILRANDINVVTSFNYAGLFGMLQHKRFDYFPRAINEAWVEVKAHPEKHIMVEKTLLLQYDAPIYFFVNKNNNALADRLERGLRIAIKDGSFEHLFENHPANKEMFKLAELSKRHIFRLENPFLPEATPLAEKNLWYTTK